MKPLRLSSITWNIRTYAALYTLDMNAIMSDYFLSKRHERDYEILINVENDINTPQLMLSMLRTLAMNLIIFWKWGAAHFTPLQLQSHYNYFLN